MNKNENKDICRIPVQATMRKVNGDYVMVDAEYADIPASAIAEFIIKKLGINLSGGEAVENT